MRHIIEHFEGFVTEVKEDTFWVRAEDVDGDEFAMEIISDKVLTTEEKEYLQLGAIFDWVLFNNETQWFIFCKERWTQEQIDGAHKEAKKLCKLFHNNNNKEPDDDHRQNNRTIP